MRFELNTYEAVYRTPNFKTPFNEKRTEAYEEARKFFEDKGFTKEQCKFVYPISRHGKNTKIVNL